MVVFLQMAAGCVLHVTPRQGSGRHAALAQPKLHGLFIGM
jgi:hypothetical protein